MSAWRQEWDQEPKRPTFGGGAMGNAGSPGMVPFWVKRLLIANLGIYVVMAILGSSLPGVVHGGLALSPDWWWLGAPFLPIWQLVTYGFLHAGIGHVFFNCLMLYFFGGMLERAIGGRRFIVFYAGAMIAGGLLHSVLGQFQGLNAPVIGASGAIMGCITAAAMLFPNSQVHLFGVIPIPLWVLAAGMVAVDLLSMADMGGSVAHDVHLAGALVGFLYIKQGWYRTDVLTKVEQHRQVKVAQNKAADNAKLDALLARISKEGMSSLTDGEKQFLNRMSKRP
ncbi:MAG: rhomboid family intramembrane serine protease [Planctomycetota bacterium]|nr:rhomboid family intramembrane serine protease [Planctomycetota bacterium]